MPAAGTVPCPSWTSRVALGKSLGFPGPQLPAAVKGGDGFPHRAEVLGRQVRYEGDGMGGKVSRICPTKAKQ